MSRTDSSVAAALKHAETHCTQRGVRMTPLRRNVLSLLVEAGEPVKAYDLLDRMRAEDKSAKPPTVYRSLDFLMEVGLAHKVEALNAYIACAHCHDKGGAELYICGRCGDVEERHGVPQPQNAPDGFVTDRSVVEHYGVCANCR
ncbi:transcriptional repressor [Hyphobacterium sp.]|uniref:transcriptional repressor n=1 Tax=Hyphobacterium sp. TaxID=2004662 RepID=UPI003BA90992